MNAIIGGAAMLSPRHVLLTAHQSHSETQIHYIHSVGKVQTKLYVHDIDYWDKKAGWEIRELSTPLRLHTPVVFARDPSKYVGQWCFVLKDTDPQHFHPQSMEAFLKSLKDTVKIQAYRGILYDNKEVTHFRGSDFKEKKLYIRMDQGQGLQDHMDLQGSSGYPVVVYDSELTRWITIGISHSSFTDSKRGDIVAVVVYPPYELIEQIQSQWPMVESTQPKAE